MAKAKLPKRAGFGTQVQFRNNTKKSKHTMRRYRVHYRLMFTLEGDYIRRCLKRLPEPDSLSKTNQHGGVMPALPSEFELTNKQAGALFQKCAKHTSEISYDQLRGMSGVMSYLFNIKGGKAQANFPLVKKVLEGYDETDFGQTKTLKPTSIPSPKAIKKAFTTPYHPRCGMTLTKWVTACLACWCWCVWGARSGCDIESLKKSEVHAISPKDGWASIAYKAGRNKLCGKKAGTRPWTAYFVCTCPSGTHIPVDKEVAQWGFDKKGNCTEAITWCTECPIACLELKIYRAQRDGASLKVFSKWTATSKTWGPSNHGPVVQLALEWLTAQGANGARPFCSNSGRKALAGWLEEVKAPYPQGFEIHGDLFDVWSVDYQPSVPYSDFGRRTQSPVPRIATKALRRLAHFFGRSPVPKVPTLDLNTMLTIASLRAQGEHELVEQVLAEHRRLHAKDDEKNED